jgi:hypothetical protein
MSNIAIRPVGYTGVVDEIVWASGLGNNVSVTAYLWGGGGGGGGNDSASGGSGSGGGFSTVNFTLNEGDNIKIAIGGPGGPGASNVRGYGSGTAGASLTTGPIFTTRQGSTPPSFAKFNSAYGTFLNTFGVWESNTFAGVFDRTYVINAPVSANYTFTMSADNNAACFVDGTVRFSSNSFVEPFQQIIFLTAGLHTLRIYAVNTGGPGSVALTIDGGTSYSGARGGDAGGSGTSGAGGGGGGATVLLLNDVVLAIAGGGGGGGGGGNRGAATGQNAPGPRGQAAPGNTAGQNGENKAGDGGGAGGGGGGYAGGNGGLAPGGDEGGGAGSLGQSYSLNGPTLISQGQASAGAGYPYYSGERGRGGNARQSGTPGYAVLAFLLNDVYVKYNGQFENVQQKYVKRGGIWQPISDIYVKQNNQWQPTRSVFAPVFNTYPSLFGIVSREADPAPVDQSGGGWGYTGGGD